MHNLIIKSPTNLAISINQLKAHLRIMHNYDDEYLKNIVNMATNILENKISDSILTKTYKYTFDMLSNIVKLPIRSINEIISVTSNGNSVPFKIKDKGELLLDNVVNNINVIYTAGITNDPKYIPLDLQYAILEISKNIYEQNVNDLFGSVRDTLNKYIDLEL